MDRAYDGVRRLKLVGEYDLADKPQLSALFGTLPPGGPATIDMTDVTYIDTTYLHEVDVLRLRLKGHRVTLVGLNKNLQRLLHIVNFDHLLDIVAA
jgi:anti-anti-sigma regulatory factor